LGESPAAEDELDRALVRRCLDGDRLAAEEIVNRYQRRLFNAALRMLGNVQDAEDVTQTVFGNVFVSLAAYNPKFRFFSWVYRMVVNESLNAQKRHKRLVGLDDSADVAAPESDSAAAEAEVQVMKALQGLKVEDRSVVVMKHISLLSYEEIADVLHIPVKTVKSRLFTARERLRTVLLAQGTV
jgi:RNA polymerase sigma-70 factor (ECF subfamily)